MTPLPEHSFIAPVTEFIYPGCTTDPLASFRAACAEFEGPHALPPIERITAVGAVCTRGALSENDTDRLLRVAETCGKAGMPISPRATVTALNIAHDDSGDFLKRPPAPADMIVVLAVFNGRSTHHSPNGYFNQSPNHFRRGAWYYTAEATGAKAIMTIGGDRTEITVKDFRPASRKEASVFEPFDIRPFDPQPMECMKIETLIRHDVAEVLKKRLLKASYG